MSVNMGGVSFGGTSLCHFYLSPHLVSLHHPSSPRVLQTASSYPVERVFSQLSSLPYVILISVPCMSFCPFRYSRLSLLRIGYCPLAPLLCHPSTSFFLFAHSFCLFSLSFFLIPLSFYLLPYLLFFFSPVLSFSLILSCSFLSYFPSTIRRHFLIMRHGVSPSLSFLRYSNRPFYLSRLSYHPFLSRCTIFTAYIASITIS